MAFSYPQISHQFQIGGGQPATGAVEFSLLDTMSNGTASIMAPAIESVNLDSSGNLSTTAVASNLDPLTEPTPPWNSSYRVDIQITGAQSLSYIIDVPPIQTETNGSIVAGALTTLVLSSLTPKQFMVGQSVVCAGNIPVGATVISVNTTTNTASMSTAGTAGTVLSVVLGTSVDLSALLPTVPQPL